MYAMRRNALPYRIRQSISAASHRPPTANSQTGLEGSGRHPEAGTHLLLVAKDTASRAALTAFLAAKGIHVTATGSEEEALHRLARAPLPALVLLDLDTAVGESLEICRHRLQTSRLQRIPLVAVSSGPCLPAPLAVALGIVAHLDKPVYRDTLLETVTRLCA